MSGHVPSMNGAGEVVTTQEWAARRVAAKTSLTVDQAREALQAWYDLAWGTLMSGYRLRLGDVGNLAVVTKKGRIATLVSAQSGETFVTQTRPAAELRGRLSSPFREAWCEENEEMEDVDE